MSKVTSALLKKIFPATPASKRDRFVAPFNEILPKYDITTKKRFAAFIANVGIESDRLKALEEYASGNAYDTRTSLGNTPERDGDGALYKGRDVLQTTGKYNYWKVVVTYLRVLTGKNWDSALAHSDFQRYTKTKAYQDLLEEADKYNVNFLKHPQLLGQFPHAVEAACIFVKDNDLNAYADKGQFRAYAGVLNTGSPRKKAMHLELRTELYDLAMRVIPDDFDLDAQTDTKVNKPVDSEPVEGTEEPDTQNVKIEVEGDNVKVETNGTSTPADTAKIAVVATKPPGFFTLLWAKVTGAIMGNGIIQWGLDQLEKLQALSISQRAWLIITVMAAIGTVIWLISEAVKGYQRRKRNKELEQILVDKNSTLENRAQVIHPDDVEYFKAKGWKIINSGEKLPTEVTQPVVEGK